MRRIFNGFAWSSIAVQNRTGIEDGKPVYSAAFQSRAVVLEFTESDVSRFGEIHDGKIFLFHPACRIGVSSRIIFQAKVYTVRGIKVYHSLRFGCIGLRVAAGAAS